MLHPHNHTEDDGDLVTFHALRTPQQMLRHLERDHGYQAAPLDPFRAHAEEHAVALSLEDQGAVSEAEKRGYAAELLRRLAKDRLGELDHVHLPLPGGDQSVSIVATEEVESWLYGLATRVQNGADL
jgi:hypothetical protein